MRLERRPLAAVFAWAAVIGLVTGCSSPQSAASEAVDQNVGSRGPITYVQGKDNNNIIRPLIQRWNATHPDEKVTLKEQSGQNTQQYEDLVQNFQVRNADYDVVSLDVVWTAAFAARGWLQPLKGSLKIDMSRLLKPTVQSATYHGIVYAAPRTSDGALLYYRKDLVERPPTTWAELLKACAIAKRHRIGCYSGQYAKSESLTVNVVEAISSAGGAVVGPDGKSPTLDTPEAKQGLTNLVSAVKDGVIPAAALTYQEEESRQAFQSGKLLFLRNWPYVYTLAQSERSSAIAGRFGVAPIPGATGMGASTLGGNNAAISVYSKHKATARDFIAFLQSDESQRFFVTQGALAPVLAKLYDDPELNKKLPYLSTFKTALEHAVPRPVSPFYRAISRAIQDNAYPALKGEKSVEQALADITAAIKVASAGN